MENISLDDCLDESIKKLHDINKSLDELMELDDCSDESNNKLHEINKSLDELMELRKKQEELLKCGDK